MDRLEQLRKLTEMSPDDPLAHYAVALEYINRQRYQDALAAFEQTLRADSGYVPAYYHKARAAIRAGQPDLARATLKRGIEVAQAAGDTKTVREMRELLETIQ
ncbi:MAG: tetratricopeptide repeat protein [Planctomycetota bacterium]